MLFYLVKPSCLDITKSIQELSMIFDGEYPAAFTEMLCVIRYVLDTKDNGLKFEPNLDKEAMWDLICYSDSDYARDTES